MLADPAETRIACQGLLEHRCAVGECTVAAAARCRGDAGRESCETRTHDLVIVATERIARDVAARWIGKRFVSRREIGCSRRAAGLRPVIHAGRNYTAGTGHELGGAGA